MPRNGRVRPDLLRPLPMRNGPSVEGLIMALHMLTPALLITQATDPMPRAFLVVLVHGVALYALRAR